METIEETSPRKFEYNATPTWPERPKAVVLPPSLRNRRVVTIGSGIHSWEKSAEEWGLGWMKILKPCLGYKGQPLWPGDLVELPLNWMHQFLCEGQASWVPTGKEAEEVAFVEKAKKFGYKVEVPQVPLRERPEYQGLQKPTQQKRSGWMDLTK